MSPGDDKNMSDFIIQIGESVDPQVIARRLQGRPGMKDRTTRTWRFDWGSAVIQSPPGKGYEPHEAEGSVYACIGRPRVIGVTHEDDGPTGFGQHIFRNWRADSREALLERLTGMFALVSMSRSGFSVVTDLLGSQPIYQAADAGQRVYCVGSVADLVAEVSGRKGEIDLASVGEFIVFDQITFPYTTYRDVREIGPAAVHSWQLDDGPMRTNSNVYWTPAEPANWPSRSEVTDDLEQALRLAANEVSRGAKHLAITLSGGRDSRTVLAVLKTHGIDAALTYCTRENRETQTAAQVANSAGVPHVLVRRSPHFYGQMLARTMPLIGSEVRGVAHGLAIVDAGLADKFDVVVGGYLSDTLLKDHFMPHVQREQFRPKSLRERLRKLLQRPRVPDQDTCRWAASPNLLSREIRTEVERRRVDRRQEIAKIRPETAAEWQGFWPISRQHDVGAAWGNNRLFCADELFYFREVVQVAARLSPADRYVGRATHDAFNRVCGELNALVNANTGVAANAGDKEEGRYFKRLRTTGRLNGFRNLPPSDTPWNDVQHSWADSRMLLTHSPDWQRYRAEVVQSPAADIIQSVLSADNRTLISEFHRDDDPRVSMALIQMGLHIEHALS